jgi:copper chaperone CopZ
MIEPWFGSSQLCLLFSAKVPTRTQPASQPTTRPKRLHDPARSQGGLETLVFKITGMAVTADATAVEAALRRVVGVARCAVSLLTGQAEVLYDPNVAGAACDDAVVACVHYMASHVAKPHFGTPVLSVAVEAYDDADMAYWAAALAPTPPPRQALATCQIVSRV